MKTILRTFLVLSLFGLTAAFNVGLVEIRIQEIDYLLGKVGTDQQMSNALGIVAKYELIKRRLEHGEEDVQNYEFEAKMQALTSGGQFTRDEQGANHGFYLVPVRTIVNGIRLALGKPIINTKEDDKIFHVLEIGYFWERTRKYPDAIKIYDQVLDMQNIGPEIRAAVLLHKAFCHSMISDYRNAKIIYERVINQFPNTEAGMLAWKLLAFIDSIERQRDLVKDSRLNDFDMAKQFYMLMDYRNAIKFFGRFLAKKSSSDIESESRFFKGRSHEELGEVDEAVDEYRRVMRIDTSKRWSREANRRLLMLGEFYEQKKQMAEEARRQLAEYQDQNFMDNVQRFAGMVSENSLRNELMAASGTKEERVQVAADAKILALLNSIGNLEGKREEDRIQKIAEVRKQWVDQGMTEGEIRDLDRMINLYQNPARKPAQIGEIIRDNSDQLKYIYNKRLRDGVKVSGKMVVEIKIQAAGTVLSSRLIQSNVGDKQFEDAVLNQISTWKFRSVPDSLGIYTISYPFEFHQEI
jgi:TonB family protein